MTGLLLGARLAVTGGREAWLRTLLTALGIGAGVAMLLLAASVPGALEARQARGEARLDLPSTQPPAGGAAVLVAYTDTEFRDRPIRGRIVRPQGPAAPVPPGVTALPGPGELLVSPALRRLLDSPDGALLAPRLPASHITGTIGPAGLTGPGELAYYAGSDRLDEQRAVRLERFGGSGSPGEPYPPMLILLVIIMVVVLLLPIAVFVGAAVRFGGERRDRRLAALRLVGADVTTTRLVAAGEAAAASLLGLAAGGLMFAAGRQLVPLVTLADISVYAGDVRPALPLVAAIALAVPLLAVVVTLVALRAVVIEPLGVSRRALRSRLRLWWRLLVPVAGLALLLPVATALGPTDGLPRYQIVAGAVLLLTGTVILLPWLLDLLLRRLGAGPVAWQLAVRQLQLNGSTPVRLVGGVAVAVAGTIGLQALFTGVQTQFTVETGADPTRAQVHVQVSSDRPWTALEQLAATPGVRPVAGTADVIATLPDQALPSDPGLPHTRLRLGDCPALAEFARLDRCADGDVFLVDGTGQDRLALFRPGREVTLATAEAPDESETSTRRWTIPRDARTAPPRDDPYGSPNDLILVTRGALDPALVAHAHVSLFATLDGPDALERLRNTAAQVEPFNGYVTALTATRSADRFVDISRALYVGTVVALLVIGFSMLIGIVEQLRERRRLLAMLVAMGTPRRTLTWSLLAQTVLPMLVGLALAVPFGLALGKVLLVMVQLPADVPWSVPALASGLAMTVVLLFTGAGLPALWRLLRPDSLRTE